MIQFQLDIRYLWLFFLTELNIIERKKKEFGRSVLNPVFVFLIFWFLVFSFLVSLF